MALAGLGLGLVRCSLVYGEPPVGQCTTDSHCQSQAGLGGSRCDVEHGVCVLDAIQELSADARSVCLPREAEPAPSSQSPLLSPDCPCLEGAWQDPKALVVGTIAPHTFSSAVSRPVQIPHVPRWLRSIELGLGEWQAEIPDGRLPRASRPLALLHCNSNDELRQARRAMSHLLEVAQAPVVLTLTDNDTNAVRYQALRQGATLICSTCFAEAVEAPSETGLIWQIAAPLVRQAPLAVFRVGELAARLRSEAGLDPTSPVDVVTLSQPYPGIDELVGEIERSLGEAGGYRLSSVETVDPRAQGQAQIVVAREVVRARPQVIVVGMDTDFTTYYLRMIEAEWPPGVPRPYYVLTHLNQELGLFADIVGDDDELPRRIGGTGFGLSARVAQNLAGLEQRFERVYSERLENTQYGYDAFYAAAYALMLTDRLHALGGQELSASLAELVTGPATNVGPDALRSSLGYLHAGRTLDLVGTSGELDWHRTRHQPESDVVLWCLTRGAGGELALLPDAGPRWHHATSDITGNYACP